MKSTIEVSGVSINCSGVVLPEPFRFKHTATAAGTFDNCTLQFDMNIVVRKKTRHKLGRIIKRGVSK